MKMLSTLLLLIIVAIGRAGLALLNWDAFVFGDGGVCGFDYL